MVSLTLIEQGRPASALTHWYSWFLGLWTQTKVYTNGPQFSGKVFSFHNHVGQVLSDKPLCLSLSESGLYVLAILVCLDQNREEAWL